MANIPPDILAAQAAGKIPDDVSLGYLAESRDGPAKAAIIVLGCVAFITMMGRFYSRMKFVKKFGLDDYLAFLTMFLDIAFITLCIFLIISGSGRHQDYIQYVLTNDEANKTEILDSVAHLIYTTCLFAGRLSGLALYYRVIVPGSRLAIFVQFAAVFLIAAFLPQMMVIIFHCHPVTLLWPYYFQNAEKAVYTCRDWGTVYLVNSGLSLVSDLLIFVIPVVIIEYLKVERKKKIQLVGVLLPGFLVVGISATRIFLVYINDVRQDASWYYDSLLVIECSEVTGFLIALSIPALKPLIDMLSSRLGVMSSVTNVQEIIDWNSGDLGNTRGRRRKGSLSTISRGVSGIRLQSGRSGFTMNLHGGQNGNGEHGRNTNDGGAIALVTKPPPLHNCHRHIYNNQGLRGRSVSRSDSNCSRNRSGSGGGRPLSVSPVSLREIHNGESVF